MIAACPKCTARYRVDEGRIGPEGARLKCAKCQARFRVLAPAATAANSPAVGPPSATATNSPPDVVSGAGQGESAVGVVASVPPSHSTSAEDAGSDRECLVVVADPNVESGKATASQLSAWGLQPILVHDGVEAMLTIQRMLPRAVVLDAALPKMYGFQVCEVIKRNESLRDTGVVLVGAIHDSDRFRREPVELYGADYYIEQPDLPDGLGPLFDQMGLALPGRDSSESAATPTPDLKSVGAPSPPKTVPELDREVEPVPPVTSPSPEPTVAAVASAGGVSLEERSDAERLARIIVSDITLYQPDKFAEAVRRGDVVEAMDREIGEGRVLFAKRVEERIRAERDFIVEELLRVARDRGMQ